MKNILTKPIYLSKGFTLLETLTSIIILSLVIVGPLSVIIGSSSYARQTKDMMTATYLAEEAIELLQNQYDSLFVYCKNKPEDTYCATTTDETSGQISWRLFKERLGSVGGYPSCYFIHNASGCNFDYISMLVSPTTTPAKYVATDMTCHDLLGVASTTSNGEILYSYVCSGLPSHQVGVLQNSRFSRIISVEQLPTFEVAVPEDEQYHDDLRVSVTIKFRGVNGVERSVSVVRFFHARP